MFTDQLVPPVRAARLDALVVRSEIAEQRFKPFREVFDEHPEWQESFLAWVAAMRGEGADSGLELDEAMRLFGWGATRTLLIAFSLSESISSKLLGRNPKTGKFLTPTAQVFKFATATCAAFGEESRHGDTAYAAGLLFDLLIIRASVEDEPVRRKRIAELAQTLHIQALATAKLGLRIARHKKRLALGDHLISVIFLEAASQVAMAMVYDDYTDFLKQCAKNLVPRSALSLAEQSRYGGTHQRYAHVLSWTLGCFSKLSEIVLNQASPYALADRSQADAYDLASICFLSQHLHENKETYAGSANPISVKNIRPELLGFDLTFKPSILTRDLSDGEEEEEEEEE